MSGGIDLAAKPKIVTDMIKERGVDFENVYDDIDKCADAFTKKQNKVTKAPL